MRRGPTIEDVLVGAGLARERQIESAREARERSGGSLLFHLVKAGVVSEDTLVRGLARAQSIPAVSLGKKRIDPEVLGLVGAELAEKHRCLPLFIKPDLGMQTLYLGLEDPTDQTAVDDVSFRVGLRVRPVVVGPVELRRALRMLYPKSGRAPADAPSELREEPIEPGDTAPVVEVGEAPSAVPDPQVEPTGEAAEHARDVRTREILRAVTGLLIEKGVITRTELVDAVRALDRSTEGD